MNKYDFGYNITNDHSNFWAFQKVQPYSIVLEIGSSNGRLTKHLCEDLNCIVDIVEFNEDAGRKAQKYCRNSYLGEINGNIENKMVLSKFPLEEYNYIIFLDVLEHLIDPLGILKAMKNNLQENGHVLISIPNIAHNSVIINLINNRFDYTKLGLLDNTHLHFYTNITARNLLKEAGYYITEEDATQKRVGDIEIPCTYDNIPREVAAFLRTRKFADVYQVLFEASKMPVPKEAELVTYNLNYTLYKTQVYIDGSGKNVFTYFVDPQKINLIIDLNGYNNVKLLRVDPIEQNCILKIEKATGISMNQEYPLSIQKMNGIDLFDGKYVFFDDDPQIYFKCEPDTQKIILKICCISFDTDTISQFKGLGSKVLELLSENADIKAQFEKAQKIIQFNYQNLTSRDEAIQNLKNGIVDLQHQIDQLTEINIKISEENQKSK